MCVTRFVGMRWNVPVYVTLRIRYRDFTRCQGEFDVSQVIARSVKSLWFVNVSVVQSIPPSGRRYLSCGCGPGKQVRADQFVKCVAASGRKSEELRGCSWRATAV